MKVALVYDRVNKFGGAEQVLLALHKIWPEAPLFTAVYNRKTAAWAERFLVKPSWLQGWPGAKTHHEFYPWLTPLAFESFDFSGYDVVISVASAEAKAILTPPKTLHLNYCLTPTRYLWSHQKEYLAEPGLGRWLSPWQKRLQQNDLVYAQRPDEYIAISKTVQRRIKKYYQRDSSIIYPPVEMDKFHSDTVSQESDYFLIVSRLVAYKRIDLAIKAFNYIRRPIVIVGTGRDKARLKRLAGPTVKFAGWVSKEKLIDLYQHCRALVMPQEEDFGIAAVEAQAAGRPVIAWNQGGARETVQDQVTGILYAKNRVDSLTGAVKQFEERQFVPAVIIKHAKKFDESIFMINFKNKVEAEWQKHQSKF